MLLVLVRWLTGFESVSTCFLAIKAISKNSNPIDWNGMEYMKGNGIDRKHLCGKEKYYLNIKLIGNLQRFVLNLY